MSVEVDVVELAKEVHANAVAKGFWEAEGAAAKFGLIATEVVEFQDAFSMNNDELEEVADIVIRTLDLMSGLGISVRADALATGYTFPQLQGYDAVGNACMYLYRNAALAQQAHRKGRSFALETALNAILRSCVGYAYYTRKSFDPLVEAVLAKVEKNKNRPKLHGALY